jgi:hypothetical protein
MKLALFNDYIPGGVNGDRIVDLSGIAGPAMMNLPPTDRMSALIADFDRLRPKIAGSASSQGLPLSEVKLRAPAPRPSKMLFGLGNYRENVNGEVAPLACWHRPRNRQGGAAMEAHRRAAESGRDVSDQTDRLAHAPSFVLLTVGLVHWNWNERSVMEK